MDMYRPQERFLECCMVIRLRAGPPVGRVDVPSLELGERAQPLGGIDFLDYRSQLGWVECVFHLAFPGWIHLVAYEGFDVGGGCAGTAYVLHD